MARIPVEQRSGGSGIESRNGARTGERPVASSPDAPRRGTRTLAALLPPITRVAFRRRSPASASVLADWRSVVGPRLAAVVEPRSLRDGVLTLRCDGPTALELQHVEARLIERINVALGGAVVRRIRLQQDVLTAPAPSPVRPARGASPAPVAGAPAGPLGEALARLGAAIASARNSRGER